MREFLSGAHIPFAERDIRSSENARQELLARSGELIVPRLFWGTFDILGFNSDDLENLVSEYRLSQ